MDEYWPRLDALPFVHRHELLDAKPPEAFDALLRLHTTNGLHDLFVEEFARAVSYEAFSWKLRALGRPYRHGLIRRGRFPVLVLAPHIDATLGKQLEEAGVNYLDLRGNCHISLGETIRFHVEGRPTATPAVRARAIRDAGYRVLFAYLAKPALVAAPLREVAAEAGVSRHAVQDMRDRLVADSSFLKLRDGLSWTPHRRTDALARWLEGYRSAVRPRIVVGTFRTPDRTPEELEHRLTALLPAAAEDRWRWGGNAAAFRLVEHYRSVRTTIHLRDLALPALDQLRALPDPAGNLVVLKDLGEVSWPAGNDTVHPLLVHSEMLAEHDARAREAADELFRRVIQPRWEAA